MSNPETLFSQPPVFDDEGQVYVYTVGEEDLPCRLDHFLAARSAAEPTPLSRSRAAALCLDGRVTVNGRADTKNAKLKAGDTVAAFLPPPAELDLQPEDIPLDVVFEDGDIIVVNKPQGMVVHPAPGHPSGTLCSALLFHCGDSLSGIGGVSRPGIVHRIDKDTSGLIVAAKNDLAHASLAAQIKEHSARRTYEAIVAGTPGKGETGGTVDLPIGRHPVDRKKMAVRLGDPCAREAVTHWEIISSVGAYSHIRCRLETGRTHQIRVHMSYTGHPVLGDPLYGGDSDRFVTLHPSLFKGQMLHAAALELTHPRSGERMTFSAPPPENFRRALGLIFDS
ncbi:MAG: RluA family pseudouridine synthase [Clostridia bacterium]|nr:RluA family pseudouridine synthase [Clostridia bacterium]